jgi:hypothetical protein
LVAAPFLLVSHRALTVVGERLDGDSIRRVAFLESRPSPTTDHLPE